jgi:hypothetical protein
MPDAILDLGGGPFRVHSILEEVHQSCILPYLAVIGNRKVDIGIVPHHWRWRAVYLRTLNGVKVCSDGIILVDIVISASHQGKAGGDDNDVPSVSNVIHPSICRIMVTRQRVSWKPICVHVFESSPMFDLDIVLLEYVCPAGVHPLEFGVRHQPLQWFVVSDERELSSIEVYSEDLDSPNSSEAVTIVLG